MDWLQVHEELKGKNVTLSLVWQEYRDQQADAYQYSRFCELYGAWRGKLDLCMRQVHRPGEKLFVDYCGTTVPVVDAETGEVREAQIFVAVWGASSYTFAEATWSQGLADWIGSHVRAIEFAGGLTELVIPDPCVSVRAGAQPNLPGSGGALRRGGDAGAGAQAAGQGQGRSGGATRPAMDPGAAAASAFFLAPRAQPGDPAASRPVERPPFPQVSRFAPFAVRQHRTAGSSSVVHRGFSFRALGSTRREDCHDGHSLKFLTSTASPAEPGELSWGVRCRMGRDSLFERRYAKFLKSRWRSRFFNEVACVVS